MQDINNKMGQLNIVFWNCASEILNKLGNYIKDIFVIMLRGVMMVLKVFFWGFKED